MKQGAGRVSLVSKYLGPVLLGLVALGVGTGLYFYGPFAKHAEGDKAKKEEEKLPENTVKFGPDRWAASGIEIATTEKKPFVRKVWRTGKLAVDETRVAHISPMMDGILREVRVRLGQNVTAGQVLAMLDCRDVGQAKLELVKVRLSLEFAQSQYDRTRQTTENALAMVESMLVETPIVEIEKRFKDRPIGDLRQQLMGSYSKRLQAKSQFDSVSRPESRGAVSEATIIKNRSEYETAESIYRALCEELKNQGMLQVRASQQKLREAQTALSLARAQLMMYGYRPEEVDQMDPLTEGSAVSLYPVRAPFMGTILEQHAVIAERISPNVQMFQIADLSRLWLQTDIYESDLSFVNDLAGQKIRFRTNLASFPMGEAQVFSVGGSIDPATRTLPITATVDNTKGMLKAGMFAEVELSQPGPDAITLPLEAIQRDGAQAFVFVLESEDLFRKTNVTLGRESQGFQEIETGLQPGQKVAVKGGFILKSELMKDLIAGE